MLRGASARPWPNGKARSCLLSPRSYTRRPMRMSARSAWTRPPPAAMRACSPAPAAALRPFDDRKALELRVAEIVDVVGAGVAVRGAEILRLRPGGEIVLRRPHRV